jgi:hypothetical protein
VEEANVNAGNGANRECKPLTTERKGSEEEVKEEDNLSGNSTVNHIKILPNCLRSLRRYEETIKITNIPHLSEDQDGAF